MDEHERRFRDCGQDLKRALNRKRNVDETVVDAVRQEILDTPLRRTTELVKAVNHRLGRQDLNARHITTALESISVVEVRPILRRQVEEGKVSYNESSLLATMMARFSPEAGEFAGLSAPEPSGTRVSGLREVTTLVTPDVPMGAIALSLLWLTFMFRLFYSGVPLSALAQWCHVHPTTILRWILALAFALWPGINRWVTTKVTCTKAYVDEKWITIRNHGYDWCVVLDAETGLPVYHALLATRSSASVEWIVAELRHLKHLPGTFITDGLGAYKSVFAGLAGVTHVLCRFHHQQGVTRWLKDHFPADTDVSERKATMKQVFHTTDTRTVRRRLSRLKERAEEWGLAAWVDMTEKLVPNLLPRVGSRRLPSTSTAIERFFGVFTRFAKVRRGFFSVLSAQRQLIVFLIGDLFSQQTTGKAPIETIMPEAARMPLYRIFNDPFVCLGELSGNQGENLKNVKEIRGIAEFLTMAGAAA